MSSSSSSSTCHAVPTVPCTGRSDGLVPRRMPSSSALQVIAGMVRDLERDGIPSSRIVLLGFSQGGCLALEFAARNAGRYGAVIGLSAGLIGPDETSRTYAGSLQGTPVFLGCS